MAKGLLNVQNLTLLICVVVLVLVALIFNRTTENFKDMVFHHQHNNNGAPHRSAHGQRGDGYMARGGGLNATAGDGSGHSVGMEGSRQGGGGGAARRNDATGVQRRMGVYRTAEQGGVAQHGNFSSPR